MEETLTDCLVRVREDLSQLKKVRAYLDTNADTEERCSVTWRTIEAFNSILSVCSSQNTPETNALDTLLDSFYYLARNNNDDCVWDDFGFELGIICVKVLSAIERSEIFEILFCKLLSVISIICEHNSNVWKAAARQILNVLINKKFSLSYLEAIVKLYICILKNIDRTVLSEFSSQNLHLLKTLSMLVQKVGDFEIQSSVLELVFLHLSKDTKLMSDLFSATETKSLPFTDFENDSRLYLNAVNKRGFHRKVYSICCHVLYLGGCFVEPPLGKDSLWVDANKDSERLSMKCGDDNRLILIQFSDIVNVQLEKDKTEGNPCLTVQAKNLMSLHKDARSNDICLVADNTEEVSEFLRFLETVIRDRKRKKKFGRRTSKTVDSVVIDRNKLEVQDNAITSSERPGVDQILPDVLSLFERESQKAKTPPKSQQLSPNSFVESLNQHIGMASPELRHTYEDSIETIEFLKKSTPSHRLFRSPDKIFDIMDNTETDFNFAFGENKENMPKTKMKTYSRRTREQEHSVLKDRKNIQIRIANTQSQDYFRTDSNAQLKRKPCLPKIKRATKQNKNKNKDNTLDTTDGSKASPQNKTEILEKQNEKTRKPETEKSRNIKIRQQTHEKEFRLELEVREKQKERTKQLESPRGNPKCGGNKHPEGKSPRANPFESSEVKEKQKSVRKSERVRKQNKPEMETTNQANVKPSLLDPNGYAYQRWCKPTTSERSNFWLKKLNAAQKHSKMEADSVFDFSEDSDSIFGKRKSRKRVLSSKQKSRTKQMSLRQMKEILKKSPPKGKPNVSPKPTAPPTLTAEAPPTLTTEVPPTPTAAAPPTPPPTVAPTRALSEISKRSSSPESIPPDSEYESVSEDGEPPAAAATKKRERSDEDSSSKKCTKKKSKTVIPRNLVATLRRRLRKTEEKDRQQTDEIIQTINRATNHLFNHLQRKDGERVVSYLKEAEAASAAFEDEVDDLNLRLKRIHRAILYYKAGCSVAEFGESLDGHIAKVRDAVKDFRGKKDTSKTIERVHVRLNGLIKSEIERTIGDEWSTKRNRLLRCATILGVDFREFT